MLRGCQWDDQARRPDQYYTLKATEGTKTYSYPPKDIPAVDMIAVASLACELTTYKCRRNEQCMGA